MLDQMNVFFGILMAFSLYVSINKLIRYREIRLFSKSHGCQDPPKELPYDFMGIVKIYSSTRHLLKKTALENTSYLFDKYGETYVSRILTQRVLFTCNPRNIKHVLVTRFSDFDNSTVRAHLFRPITEHGIFAVDGPEWKAARDVYRDQFAHTRSIFDLSKQEEHFQIFMRRIPQAGTSFDLQPLFLSLILDLTTRFALGESSDSLSPGQSEEKMQFVDALLYIKKIMARDGFLGPVHHLLSKKNFYRDCVKVQQYVERLIDRELEKGQQQGQNSLKEQGPEGYYMLRGLTQNTRNMLELRDGVITILIAGIDSVSSLLSTTFWFLARDERVFAKLRASVLDCIGHEKPTYNQLRSLTYLRYVFNEGWEFEHTASTHVMLT